MTKQNYTEILMILDRSGSMGILVNDVIGGFNEFIKKQKEETSDECKVSLVLFDDQYEEVYISKAISEITDLDSTTYFVRGMTALNDAICKACNTLGNTLANMEEQNRPSKIIVAIFTDGEENASKEYTLENVNNIRKEQSEKYGWEFVFMGTDNIDVQSMGKSCGIAATHMLSAAYTPDGTRQLMARLSNATLNYRNGTKPDMSFNVNNN